MRKIILLGLMIVTQNVYSQDILNNVKTPNYSDAIAYNTYENTDANRAYFDSHFKTAYPNATAINTYPSAANPNLYYSSTRRFNCHGYAWYMMAAEGSGLSDPRWIGYDIGNTDVHIYWLDDSYTEVPSEVYPGLVSWNPDGGGDHSALTTSTPGRYVSKWNEWPLMEHNWDDSPFGTPPLKFFQLNCNRLIEDKTINTDLTRTGCEVQLRNVTIENNVSVNISFDNLLIIDGTFHVPVGATLILSP